MTNITTESFEGAAADGEAQAAVHAVHVGAMPPYPVYLEEGIAFRCGGLFAEHGIRRAVLISNPVVGALYGGAVRNAMRAGGVEVDSAEVPDGEAYKTVGTVERLWERLADLRADRATALVALGGGVLGDLVGFAAATWLRGVPLVHIPTTVLAMVDSSVGGKVGVDLPQGKNLVGAFYNPRFVVSDPSLLLSLPPRVLAAGMAEVVKAACIASPALFEALEAREPALGPQSLGQLIATAIDIKARIVSEDPYERGVRATLNLGHTLGHALEAGRGYHQILHGEAVSQGMMAAIRISRALGVLEDDYEERLAALLTRMHLPTRIADPGWERVKGAMGVDKKRVDGKLRFVLPVGLGRVMVHSDVPLELVHEVYESLLEQHASEPGYDEGYDDEGGAGASPDDGYERDEPLADDAHDARDEHHEAPEDEMVDEDR
ncbi:MAG: 3-dehydroquinate synthase [Proteobacteria bacterium]|nr:3-dehydroquinate synthase [Pseudomonadota bacterium]